MGDPPKANLTLLPGGRTDGDPPAGRPLSREALRVIPGGPAGDLQAAIEETVQAARKMRQEIEERIAKALEELF
jgi:dissimilatory sulfite reductase (desulfoviridin) alpha/beta subunit